MVDAHLDGDSGVPPVTICCARSDEAAVREAADALEARGHEVGLAVGVDADQEILTRAIVAQQGRGLFVLCRSHALDRNAVDELREILRTHDVPFGRTLTLAVDTQRPREVEERIVSVLRRMVTGRTDQRPPAWGSAVLMQDDDPDTTIRRPGGASGVADPAAVLAGLGTEPEDADPYASTSQIEMRTAEAAAAAAVPYTGADHTAVGPAPAPRPALPAALPVMSPASPAPLGFQGSPSEVESSPRLAPSLSESDSLGSYTPRPVSAAEESSADFETPLTAGGRMGRALSSPAGLAVVLGGLAVVVLVVLVISLLGDGNGEGNEAQASSAPTPTVVEGVKAKAEADAPQKATSKASAEPEADEAAPKPSAEAPAAERPPAAAADPGEAPAKVPARTADPKDDPPDVVAALRSREVRAIDIFVVAPERKGTLSFEQAVAYCDSLEIAGLGGWRVPEIGELNSVATAKMLGKAIYWSATAGDSFGDLMLVLNTKKNSISVVTKGWDGAKIVCIRPRQP